MISDAYRQLNATLHQDNPKYGTSSSKWATLVTNYARALNTQDILDYGCGKGLLKQALGWDIKEYDPAIPGKDLPPTSADLVVCTDVLEHIEPEYLNSVLDDLQRLTRQRAFITVATSPAKKFLQDGRNAHLIQQPLSFWLPLFWERFEIIQLENIRTEFAVLLESKSSSAIK